MAPSFLQRLGLSLVPRPPAPQQEIKTLNDEPKRLAAPPEVKANGQALLPVGAYQSSVYQFFSPDGGYTIIDLRDLELATSLAFAAYWYVATRWRAQKIAEAPLIVVKEDQKTGTEEWIPDHELVPVLETPSPDYDMGQLLERTSHYLDNTGACLWVKSFDNANRVARFTPFHRNEFEIERTEDRLYGRFRVTNIANLSGGGSQQDTFDAEQVVFFQDWIGGWDRGKSRLDVAAGWLRLGEKAMTTVYSLLSNSVWPSGVVIPDASWNPTVPQLTEYKQELQKYGSPANQGKPFVALGGGSFVQLAARIKDLIPTDILGQVESVVSSISGVPAVVLQFQIGLENSPWSQMAQARRMAYDDTVVPQWRKMERVLDRQLLRLEDDDPTHFMRFDQSNIEALKTDQLVDAQIVALWGNQASLNERRARLGLEPASKKQDPEGEADQIPELTQPSAAELLAATTAQNGGQNGNGGNATDGEDQAQTDVQSADSTTQKAKRQRIERKLRTARLLEAFREEAQIGWQVVTHRLLVKDAREISEIVNHLLQEPAPESKGLEVKARKQGAVTEAVNHYLTTDSRLAWTAALTPLSKTAVERAGAVTAADMSLSFGVIHPNLLKFAKKETAKSVRQISETTRQVVSDVVQKGISEGLTTAKIAQLVQESTGFSTDRSKLIARTETTQLYNGAPTESLVDLGRDSGRKFTKTWSTALDDRVRDEHVAMEGETVPVDQPFSNGLMFPSEPNCRCVNLYSEED